MDPKVYVYALGKINYNGETLDVVVPIEDVQLTSLTEGYIKNRTYKFYPCTEKGCTRYIEESIGRSCPKKHLKISN